MPDSMLPFTSDPQKLAKNPLGIIAMFLLLVYGIAGLAFGVTAGSLQPSERLPIIWFLVGFPVLILATFAWLVTRHHTKLYAPSDFADGEGFFRAMTPAEQRVRLDREVAAAGAELAPTEPEPATRQITSDLRTDVVLAEDLAFKALGAEFGRPILRHVSRGADEGVDGVFRLPDREVAVEVKFTRTANWARLHDEAMSLAQSFSGKGRAIPLTLLLVVVADGLTTEQRDNSQHLLERRLLSSTVPIKLRVFDFASLKAQFGVEVSGPR